MDVSRQVTGHSSLSLLHNSTQVSAAAALVNTALTAPTRTKNFTNKEDSYCRIYKWRLITILIGLARSVGKCGDSRGRRGAATDLPWCRGAQLMTGVKHKARGGAVRRGAVRRRAASRQQPAFAEPRASRPPRPPTPARPMTRDVGYTRLSRYRQQCELVSRATIAATDTRAARGRRACPPRHDEVLVLSDSMHTLVNPNVSRATPAAARGRRAAPRGACVQH
ncbi:unnamed protein product [Chrysodeixis includens]|uniref:Uncharacterized protein n=1 Tax=Chrysodeixis includens TaxID=689277 RepID=A0A9N8KWS3_CHRIL|nr:unnamed protein product [Chrysodeixis includens]